MNDISQEKNTNRKDGLSLEMGWIPNDERTEQNYYLPYSNKQPFPFTDFKGLYDQNHEKDNEIHQEKEATHFDSKNKVMNEVMNEVINEVMNEVKSEVMNEVKSEVNDDEIMKSQKSEFGGNEVVVEEVIQEIHIKKTRDIQIAIHTGKKPKKTKTKSKRKKRKILKDEEES